MPELSWVGNKSGAMPYEKYSAFQPIDLADRQWPSKQIAQSPRWCSVDLRDGNQALIEPMTVDEKMRMFELLLEVGFVEIEVGFPAASKPDFEFIRKIIDEDMVPDHVVLQVLCQAREELIQRTVESLDGTQQAIFHLYNSTSTLQRRVVFDMDQRQIIDLAVTGTQIVRDMVKDLSGTHVMFEYSPESFTGTELDFAVEICEEVAKTWGATPDDKVIINLPSTVELATPNVYADQIEYFCRNFAERDSIVVSLHTHNDRGTGVAATELALMAGAERVEGTLFGNGERTGNCDLVTVAMNLFSQGIDPQLDFRNMDEIRDIVVSVNKLPVHPRHPYVGDLVFTAFSGSHQDAIRKGMALVNRSKWEVPYLPIDPSDVGSSYRESVRVNSQSGKGGVGFILEEFFGIYLPRDMLIEFSKYVQTLTEVTRGEVGPLGMLKGLVSEYRKVSGPYRLLNFESDEQSGQCFLKATVMVADSKFDIQGDGETITHAFVNALSESINEPINLIDCTTSVVDDEAKKAGLRTHLAIVTVHVERVQSFGLGTSDDADESLLLAVLSALNQRWNT